MGKNVIWKEIAKAYLKTIARFVGARWVSPRDSQDDPECAVMEIDLDLTPDALNFLGAFIMLLARHDQRVNTDHPVFQYLGNKAENRDDASVTFKVSLKERKAPAVKQNATGL